MLAGGERARWAQFFAPMVLTDATTEMLLAREETFGPVAPLFRFETEAEAVALANGTPFGLAAYFYTATCAAPGGWVRRWSSAWSGSTRGNLDRGRTLRRREAVGPRPRGSARRDRGVSRDQGLPHGRPLSARALRHSLAIRNLVACRPPSRGRPRAIQSSGKRKSGS